MTSTDWSETMSKVVFITGASSGFGKETAKKLSHLGFTVYGTSRKAPTNTPLPWTMLQMDVCDPASIAQAVSTVLAQEGRIDVLVNNAGISTTTALEGVPMDDLEEVLDTNVKGPLRMCQAVLPTMRKQKGGLIINVSSIAGLLGLPFMGTYSASKFALEGMMEALSMEVKPFGITVCLVEPGDFNTEILQHQKASPVHDQSPYFKAMMQMKATSDRNMAAAPGPKPVADRIVKIIRTKNPRLRYRVGNPLEKASIFIKALLPSRLFEALFIRIYGLNKE